MIQTRHFENHEDFVAKMWGSVNFSYCIWSFRGPEVRKEVSTDGLSDGLAQWNLGCPFTVVCTLETEILPTAQSMRLDTAAVLHRCRTWGLVPVQKGRSSHGCRVAEGWWSRRTQEQHANQQKAFLCDLFILFIVRPLPEGVTYILSGIFTLVKTKKKPLTGAPYARGSSQGQT